MIYLMFPEFSNVVHILAVIPATSCYAERSFSALRRLKTYLRSTMGQQRVSSITLINIERAYVNSVFNNDMDRIIDIFRGVACIFRGVRTVENVHEAPKARAAEGSGGMPPTSFRARKCHFPCFSGNSFINQNITKRRVFSN